MDPVEVLAIGGTGQNGATLLTRMLGRLPGMVAVGELGRLWDTGIIENRPCGCGVAFRDCPFWARVGQAAFGGWDGLDAQEISRLREAVRLKRRLRSLPVAPVPDLRKIGAPQALPFLIAPGLWPEYRRSLRRYTELMGRLYRGIHEVSGGAVIVDSMKVPYHVYMLRRVPAVRLRVGHLVRDSRGVAHSSMKVVKKQGSSGVFRGRRHPLKTGWRWDWVNLTFHLLWGLGVPTTFVRYETFVTSPRQELRRIAEFAGLSIRDEDVAFIRGGEADREGEADLPPDHLVAGNRMRMQTGPVRLRVSEEWKTELNPRQRRLVSLVTWPLLRRYDYVGRRAVSAGTR